MRGWLLIPIAISLLACGDNEKKCKELSLQVDKLATSYAGGVVKATKAQRDLFVERCVAWPDRYFKCYRTAQDKESCQDAYEALELSAKGLIPKDAPPPEPEKQDPSKAKAGPSPAWKAELPGTIEQLAIINGDEAIASWTSKETGEPTIGFLAAGQLRWQRANAPVLAAIAHTAGEDTCYLVHNPGRFECLNAATGEPMWSVEAAEATSPWLAVDGDGQVAVAAAADGSAWKIELAQCQAEADAAKSPKKKPKTKKDEEEVPVVPCAAKFAGGSPAGLKQIEQLLLLPDRTVLLRAKERLAFLDADFENPVFADSVSKGPYFEITRAGWQTLIVEKYMALTVNVTKCRAALQPPGARYPVFARGETMRQCGKVWGNGGPFDNAVFADQTLVGVEKSKLAAYGASEWKVLHELDSNPVIVGGNVLASFKLADGIDFRAVSLRTGKFVWRTRLDLPSTPKLYNAGELAWVVSGKLIYAMPGR